MNYLKRTVFKICFFLTPLSILAQKPTGLKEDDIGYSNQPMMPLYSGSKVSDLPPQVSLKPYCPEPRNQGDIQSCVGWSIGYGALSIEKAIKNKWTDTKLISEQAFSALFIYNQIKGAETCEKAKASMSDAMDFLKNEGNCLAKEFDTDVNNCIKKPTLRLLEEAKKNTLNDAIRLFPPDTPIYAKIKTIKMMLAQKKPVVISLRINAAFGILKDKKYWNPPKNEILTEPHAIVVIGYDDVSNSFELLNSWGKGWGDNGFIRIKYADLAQNCPYAYVIYPNDSKTEAFDVAEVKQSTPSVLKANTTINSHVTAKSIPEKPLGKSPEKPMEYPLVDLAGRFEINQLMARQQGGYRTETVQITRKGHHYILKNTYWRVGQLFQLALSSEFSGAYIYAFSINNKNEVNVLYPRNEEYGDVTHNETPLVMLEGARILLPREGSAIQVTDAGTDRICILFSLKKIKHLLKIGDLLKNAGDNFDQRLYNILGDDMIPLADTNFEDDAMAFSIATRSKGAIVPIIIEYQTKE